MTAPVPDPCFRDQPAGAVRAVDSATTCPICGDRRTSKLDLGIHVADDHPAAEVEARVQAAAGQMAAEELDGVADELLGFGDTAPSKAQVHLAAWLQATADNLHAAALASPAPAPQDTAPCPRDGTSCAAICGSREVCSQLGAR